MPSESRLPAEPTLEELSAYLDHELDADGQARVAEHVAGCSDCQGRLEGLRQTAYAIRGMPMESPPRTFTVPAAPRRQWRWTPVAWLGSAAVAVLLIGFGATHLHLSPGGAAMTSGGGANSAAQYRSTEKAAAPFAPPAASALDQHAATQAGAAFANGSVVDPSNGSRRLLIDTDSTRYPTNGKMRVSIQLQGSPSASTSSADQGITLTLVRNGVGVALKPVGVISWNGTPIFGGWYDLGSLPLSSPRAGDYRLMATWVIPDGSGRVFQAEVPIQLTGS